MATQVRFIEDDRFGLWRAGEVAEDLGWEQEGIGPGHPHFIPMRLLRTKHGETIALFNPFGRGLIEQI